MSDPSKPVINGVTLHPTLRLPVKNPLTVNGLWINVQDPQMIRQGTVNKAPARTGVGYRIGQRNQYATEGELDQLPDRVEGELRLSYVGNAMLALTDFYPSSAQSQWGDFTPSSSEAGEFASGVSLPNEAAGASTFYLNYVYGESFEAGSVLLGWTATGAGSDIAEATPSLAHAFREGCHIVPSMLGLAGFALWRFSIDGAPEPTVIRGSVVAGPVIAGHGLIATAYRANGTVLASGNVSADGTFTLTVAEGYTGVLLVRVHDTSIGPDYMDEATGLGKDLTTDLRAVTFLQTAGTYNLNVNLLTELAVRKFGIPGGDNGTSSVTLGTTVTANDVTAANAAVAAAVGLAQDLVQGAAPIALITANAAINPAVNNYGKLLAALSGAEVSSDTNTVLQDLAANLNANDSLLPVLVQGAANVAAIQDDSRYALIDSISNLTAKANRTSIDAVSIDNTISAIERVNGIAITGTARAGASVVITWRLRGQTENTQIVIADDHGTWSTFFARTQIPKNGATVISAVSGLSDTATRSVFVEPGTDQLAILRDYDGSGTPPTLMIYLAAGIDGVTPANLGLANSALAVLPSGSSDTSAKIQAVVSAASALLALADGSANGGTALSAAQFSTLGVTGLNGANSAINTAVAGLLSDVFDGRPNSDADTLDEVQALANAAGDVIASAAGGTVTLAQLQALGMTGATVANLATIQADLTATADDGSGVDTLAELQALITAAASRDIDPPRVLSVTADDSALNAGEAAILSVTLSEASTTFTAADLQAVGGTLTNFIGSGTSYSVTFTPDDDRTDPGSVSVATGSFTDAAGNISVSSDSSGVVITIQTLRPSATLSARQTKLGRGDVTTIDVTLSEKSSDFTLADLAPSHGTLSSFTPLGDGIHYSVLFTPDASYTGIGAVVLTAGSFNNSAGNSNRQVSTGALAIDTTPPTVRITSDVTALAIGQTAKISFEFNKDPGDSFDASDIAVNGGTLSRLTNHTGTIWTALFTPIDGSSGTANITVAVGAYSDSAGNKGAAGAMPTISVDTQGPTALLSPASATTVLPGKNLVLQFSEVVSKGNGAISLVNDTDNTRTSLSMNDSAVVLSSDGRTLTLTPPAPLLAGKQYHVEANAGSVLDAAGNAWGGIASSSTWAGSTWRFTAATPSVSLSAIAGDNVVNASESAAGVAIGGIIESNTANMVASFVASDFTVTLTPQGGGTPISGKASGYDPATGAWSLTLAAGALTDTTTYGVSISVAGTTGAANGATATTSGSVRVDLTAVVPTLALASDTGTSNADGITTNSDITVSGLESESSWQYQVASGSWQTGSGNTIKAPLPEGSHTVKVRQTDAAGNTSGDATISFTLDTTASRPVVNSVTADNIINASEISAVISGTAEPDAIVRLTLGSSGQARTITATADGSGVWTYTLGSADLAALGRGQTQVAAVQTDLAGNNSFKTVHNFTVDTTAPIVSVQAASNFLNIANPTSTLTFTLTEASGDFGASSITVIGGTLSTLTQSSTDNRVYTARFTPTNPSVTAGSVNVAAGAFHDGAGNANIQVSNTVDFVVDQLRPTVAVASSTSALAAGEVATLTFTLSEANTSFSAASVSTAGGKLGELTVNAAGTVYTGIFTPSAGFSGVASVSIADAALYDLGGNTNADGSDANNSVAISTTTPSVLTITSDKSALKARETAVLTFSFSSAPTGFAVSDITVTGGTLGTLAPIDSTHYTATFAPSANVANGRATVSVLDGSFTGAGGSLGEGDKFSGIIFDTLLPTLLSLNPGDGSYLAAAAGTRLVATFAEEILAGSGNMRLVDDTARTTQTFAAAGSAVAINGDTLTLTPGAALVAGHNYHLEIDSTALTDLAGNAYAGIANATSWNFAATNLSVTLKPVAGDSRVNITENAAFSGSLVISGTISSANPAVLAALEDGDISVEVTLPAARASNDSDNKVLSATTITYDSSTGGWAATLPAYWDYPVYTYGVLDLLRLFPVFDRNETRSTLVDGNTDSLAITITGRAGTAAAGLSATLTDTFVVDLSAPTDPIITLASDTGSSNSDAITRDGTINVSGLEAGSNWQYSLDNGATWQTGVGSRFALTADGTTTVKVLQRDAAGNASAVVSKTITLDSVASAPTMSAIASDNLINASESGSAIIGIAEAGATVSISLGGNTRSATANGSGVWSYALQAADIAGMGQGSEAISVTQTDEAGNTSAASAVVVQVDTVRPIITLANTGSATLKAGETTTITVTLNKVVPGFSATSLTVVGGTLGEFKGDATGLVYTGTFTPNADSTSAGSVLAAIGSVSDGAGNSNSVASNELAVSINTVCPTVAVSSSVLSTTTLHAGDTATLTFTLSVASSDFTAADVAVIGGTLSNWTVSSAALYTATFTPDADSTVPGKVSVASSTFSNAAGNTNADGADANNSVTFQIATRRPTVTLGSDVGTLASGQTALITFRFSEDPGSSFSSGDITATGGALSDFKGSGTQYTAVFTPTAGFNGAANITVASGSYTNTDGSLGHAGTTPNITIDTSAPTVAISRSGTASLAAGQTDTITFAFSEAPGASFTLADIAVTGGTLGALSAVTATQYVATFAPDTSLTQTAQISIASKTFADAAGNLNTDGSDVDNSLALGITGATAASSLSLKLAQDTGAFVGDGVTQNAIIQVSGLSAGAAWEYTLDSSAAAPTWISGSGASFNLPGAGIYANLAVRLQGNGSSAVTLGSTVDYRPVYGGSVALALAMDSGGSATDGITNSGLVNLSGLMAGSTWRYTSNNGLNWNSGSGSSLTLSGDGRQILKVEATDLAGNTATATLACTLDTTAPVAPNISLTADPNDGGVIVAPTNLEAGSMLEYRSQLGTGSYGAWGTSYTPPTAVGSYTLQVRQTDKAGNASASTTLGFDVAASTITSIELSAVAAGSGGFVMNGHSKNDLNARSVSSAGDVNGDGLADLIIGAEVADTNAGRSYVVFGRTGTTAIDLSTVAGGTGGFVIKGQCGGDRSGRSVSSAGDVNGDGLADLIVGAPNSDPAAGIDAGRSYVVFGKTGTAATDLSAVAAGSGGFVINGHCAKDQSGSSVSSAGDVNGDGLADLIVGASLSDPAGGIDAGRSYVVFGRTGTAAIDLSAVAGGTGGFVINGQCARDQSGRRVSSAGDVNGDGLADLIVGASFSDPAGGIDAGRSYVVFGRTGTAAIDLSAVAGGTGGFVINGQCSDNYSGYSVSSAGDVNGDGLADLIVGAPNSDPAAGIDAGRSYVVFGKTGTAATDLSAVAAGSGGFVINGQCEGESIGRSVSSAGDINGDGLADLIVGAAEDMDSGAGHSYVVFGKSSTTAINLSAVAAGNGGLVINGQFLAEYIVSGAGDVNGDGLPDLVVGTLTRRFFVIFGGTTGAFGQTLVDQLGTDAADNLIDGGTVKSLVGGAGNDTFTATAASVLYGGSGNDSFSINQAMATALQSKIGTGGNVSRLSRIDGGSGTDTLVLASNTTLDLTQVADSGGADPEGGDRIASIERIDLSASGSSLTLSAGDVARLAGMNSFNSNTGWTGLGDSVARHQLVIDGTAGTLIARGDWNKAGTAHYNGNMYAVYNSDNNSDNNTQLLLGGGRSLPTRPIDLSAVAAGIGGFVINGQCINDQSGYSVASAGDINGDGLADLIVGAPFSSEATGDGAGRSYVVFGQTATTAVNLSAVTAGSGGFVINGQCINDQSGYSVSSAGDVNGDGLADLIVGARFSDPAAGSNSGRSYVVFGKTSTTAINLSAVASGNGGFVINGQCSDDYSGFSVSSAGDVNGDGLVDLIIGANYGDPAGRLDAGRSYVVFGRTSANAIDLSAVAAGSGGFAINGQCTLDQSGYSVSSAGDVNGDGLADLIVGARFSDPATGANAGRSYVIFGKISTTGIDLSGVATGSGGFVINGQCINDQSGYSVASAGDVNGDGLADLIVGALFSGPAAGSRAGRSYVVFGQTATTAVNLSAVTAGSGGFVINGQYVNDQSGYSVSSAGDVNGDGLADLIIGARFGDPAAGFNAGRSYVVFGKTGANAVDLSAVDGGSGGFVITGQCAGDFSGSSVSGAGDVNGDGLADLIVGALYSTPAAGTYAGRSYVIFGSTTGAFGQTLVDQLGTDAADNLIDGGTVKSLVGGAGNDTFTATAASVLYGGSGSDSFSINQAMATALQSKIGTGGNVSRLSRIDGGSGTDTLVLTSNTALDLTQVADSGGADPEGGDRIASIERIDLSASGSSLTLSAGDVARLAGMNSFNSNTGWTGLGDSVARHQLVVDGTAGTLIARGDWNKAGTAHYNGNMYAVYNSDNNTQLLLGGGRSLPTRPIDLSVVAAGIGGFVINGQCSYDRSGSSVASAGDVNGDGLADLIVAAPYNDPAAGIDAGRSYVVFGKTSTTAINLSAVSAGSGGFAIHGQCAGDYSGYSVASAGDVNGDGLADLIVGAPYSDPAGRSDAGRSYVVFGKTSTTAINLSAIATGNGGFVINGQCTLDQSGYSVSSAGDVNGDGLTDLIVGASWSDPPAGSGAGRSYVVFGKTSTTAINLSAVTAGSGGFVINGQSAGDGSGYSVSSAGDVNGDGLADLIIGAPYSVPAGRGDAGRSYVVFGKTGTTAINLSAVVGGNGGFVIDGQFEGDNSGYSVSGAGDVNGDGLADLIVGTYRGDPDAGANAGRSYVIFGKTSTTSIDLSGVAAGSGGFVIRGERSDDDSGRRVSGAGDLNGDGLADLIVGAANGGPTYAGRSYVIFGKTNTTSIDLSGVAAGSGGFVVNGQCSNDQHGWSVSSAGDVNGDGLADLIVGANTSNPAALWGAGRSYVIFGNTDGTFMPTTEVYMGTIGDDYLSDGGSAQLLVGNSGHDTLMATAASVLRGGSGSDIFVIGQTMVTALQTAYGQPGNNGLYNASIDGGDGGINSTTAFGATNMPSIDTLKLLGSNISLDLTEISNVSQLSTRINSRLSGIEVIDLNGATNTVKLTAKDVLDTSDAVDLANITGFADDRQLVIRDSSVSGPITGRTAVQVDLDDGSGITPWAKSPRTVSGTNWGDAGNTYDVYSYPTAYTVLLVQQGLVII